MGGDRFDFQEGAYYRDCILKAQSDGRVRETLDFDRSIPVVTGGTWALTTARASYSLSLLAPRSGH